MIVKILKLLFAHESLYIHILTNKSPFLTDFGLKLALIKVR